MAISYPKKMREAAKAEGKKLITIDTPCMTYQTPATDEQVADLYRLFNRWMRCTVQPPGAAGGKQEACDEA